MKNTKQLILTTSRQLFNAKGYSNVTIRMIANKLNISSGNLNYHFKKREEILESLYFDMVVVFDNRINNLNSQSLSLQFLYNEIYKSMVRMVKFSFFWADLYYITNSNDKIKEHFNHAYCKRLEGTKYLIQEFIANNLMHPKELENEHELIATRLISYSNNWINMESLQSGSYSEDRIKHHAKVLISMFYPYLTAKGKSEFKLIKN